jgi:TRAP-type C4-dicarboxylate transport system permease small subunit
VTTGDAADGAAGWRDPLPLRALDAVTQAFNVAGSVLILGLMLLIGADVAGRNLLGRPVPGVPEAVSLSIVAIVFLQVPMALRMGRIARSEALLRALPARAGRALESLFDLAGIAAVGAIVWTTWPILTRAWERNLFVGSVGDITFPVWPVKVCIVAGGALLALQFAARIWRRHGGHP